MNNSHPLHDEFKAYTRYKNGIVPAAITPSALGTILCAYYFHNNV